MWLLDQATIQVIEKMKHSGFVPSAEDSQRFYAIHGDGDGYSDPSRILSIAGDQAEIMVKGVLTNSPNFFAFMFGGGNTTYGEIVAALAQAEADPGVAEVTFRIDSQGGDVDGLFNLLTAMKAATKPITALIENEASSAAYAIATQAKEIIAVNAMVRVGSVGVVFKTEVFDEQVSITSTEAPNKAPDFKTPEGVQIMTKQLDAMHEIFVQSIASGRGTTVEEVNKNFGRGMVIQAREAMKIGMIDSISKPAFKIIEGGKSNATDREDTDLIDHEDETEARSMNLAEFKTAHPNVFAEAVKMGEEDERSRCIAHLTLGEQSGDMKACAGYIRDGSGLTPSVQAIYMAAGMARSTQDARTADDATASTAAGNLNPQDKITDEEQGKQIMAMAAERNGITLSIPASASV